MTAGICLAELNATNNAVIRSFMWGSDLSGSIQGAGGVGGLLKVSYNGAQTTNCFVAFDGNGNVAALADAGGTNILAQYEYGPFGEVIRATGPMAKANPFRFSTKYQDDETDLIMYPARPYNPSAGRFLCKDPAQEQGGMNLYAFVGNEPISQVDPLGEEILVVAGRFRAQGNALPLESVQSDWGMRQFARRIRSAFQEIVGDCAELDLQEAGTDSIAVPTHGGTRTVVRKRFRITFSQEKPSCRCNDCWQLLKSAVQNSSPVVQFRYLENRDNAFGETAGGTRNVYINPGVNVDLPERSATGGYQDKRVPFPIVAWHEGIGHSSRGLGHPNIPANHASTWDGVYIDPTIQEENRAKKLHPAAWRKVWRLFGTLWGTPSRRPITHLLSVKGNEMKVILWMTLAGIVCVILCMTACSAPKG